MKKTIRIRFITLFLFVCSIIVIFCLINANFIKEKKEVSSYQAKQDKVTATTIEKNENWDINGNIKIELTTQGVLNITCTGNKEKGAIIPNFQKDSNEYWRPYKTLIKEINIDINNNNGYITNIGDYAFEGCTNLTKVKLGRYITDIGKHAFDGCVQLTQIDFTNRSSIQEKALKQELNKIEEYAFKDCKNLNTVKLPIEIDLGTEAFSECTALNNLTFDIPDDTYTTSSSPSIVIGQRTFKNCKSLEEVNFYFSIKEIGDEAFNGCEKLKKVEFKYNTSDVSNLKIGSNAFTRCKSLTSITLSANFGIFEPGVFSECPNLQEIKVTPEGKSTYAEDGVLYHKETDGNTRLICYPAKKEDKIFKIPGEVKIAAQKAFSNCSNLKRLEIESDVELANNVFFACSNLTDIIILSGSINVNSGDFYNTPNGSKKLMIYYKTGSTLTNKTNIEQTEISEYWNDISKTDTDDDVFAVSTNDNKLIISGTGEMKDYNNNDSIWGRESEIIDVEIKEGVTNVGVAAFFDNDTLKTVNIPSTVKTIGSSAFSSCSSLECIEVNEKNKNYKDVDGVLFDTEENELLKYPQKKNGTNYSIPEETKVIGSFAFESSTLEGVDIPNGVINIEDGAFSSCKKLKEISIPESVVSLGERVFYDSGLTKIIILGKNTSIEEYSGDGNDIFYMTALGKIYCWNESPVYKCVQKIEKDSYNIQLLDDLKPTIKVTGNPTDRQSDSVTLIVKAEPDEELGFELANKPYRFDDGEWQVDNTKTFYENTQVKIQVKNEIGNIAETTIDIKNIQENEGTGSENQGGNGSGSGSGSGSQSGDDGQGGSGSGSQSGDDGQGGSGSGSQSGDDGQGGSGSGSQSGDDGQGGSGSGNQGGNNGQGGSGSGSQGGNGGQGSSGTGTGNGSGSGSGTGTGTGTGNGSGTGSGNSNGSSNNGSGVNGGSSGSGNQSSNSGKDGTTTYQTIPQTGFNVITVSILITITSVLGITAYLKYRRYKDI